MRTAFIARRDQLPEILTSRGLTGRGVEVGVQRARYSEVVLSRSQLAELVLVDPWQAFDDTYRDVANVSQAEHDLVFEEAQQRLARFGSRASFWRMTSLEAAKLISNSSLDFVYLDGRHDYESVMEDLAAWFPKLRQAGVIAGHDYVDGEFDSGDFGVRSAVDEFFAAKGMLVYDTYQERPWSSWMAVPSTRQARRMAMPREGLRFGFRAHRKILRSIGLKHEAADALSVA